MTLKELKEKLNDFPEEMEDYEVQFGETAYGEPVERIEELGEVIYLNFF